MVEATPTNEASGLQDDLRRAGIEPHGWIVNRCFAVTDTEDPALRAKSMDELVYIGEILAMRARTLMLRQATETGVFKNSLDICPHLSYALKATPLLLLPTCKEWLQPAYRPIPMPK